MTTTGAHPEALLYDYALGDLGPDEAHAVERHLERCAACREEVVTLREQLVRLAEQDPPVAPPEGTLDAVVRRVRAARPRRVRPAWLMAAAMGTLVVALGLGWGVQQGREARLLTVEQGQVTRWLAQPDVRSEPLRTPQGEVVGRVLLLPGGRALFVLPQRPPDGQVYQSWSARDWTYGEPMKARGATNRAIFEARVGTDDYLCVSIEPRPRPDASEPTVWVGGLFL